MDSRDLQKAKEKRNRTAESQGVESPASLSEDTELTEISSDTKRKIKFTKEHLELLGRLSPEEKEQLFLLVRASERMAVRDIDWDKVFQDPDADTLIMTIVALPGILRLRAEEDKRMIIKLNREIGSSKLKAAWEKSAKPILNESLAAQTGSGGNEQDWDQFYLFLMLGSLETSTPEQILSLYMDGIRLMKIELILKVWGKEELKSLWTRENYEDFEELEKREYLWYREKELQQEKDDLQTTEQFVGNLSEEEKRHFPQETNSGSGTKSTKNPDRTIWDNDGFQGKYKLLHAFQDFLGTIPKERREQLLSLLKPENYAPRTSAGPHSLEQVDNFIEFVHAAHLEDKLTLEDFFKVAKEFSAEKWAQVKNFLDFLETVKMMSSIDAQNISTFIDTILKSSPQEMEQVKKGVRKYAGLGLTKLISWNRGWWDILREVTEPDAETANVFMKECVDSHERYVYRWNSYQEYKLCNRGLDSVSHVYEAIKFIEENFRQDRDLLFEIAELDVETREAIRLILEGGYKKNGIKAYDLPRLEGVLTKLPGEFENLKPLLDKVNGLSLDQKKTLLSLNKYFGSRWGGYGKEENESNLDQQTSSERYQKMEAFLKKFPVKGFRPEEIGKMMERVEATGLFYYIDPKKYNHEQLSAIIDKLVALHDGGMDRRLYLPQASEEGYLKYLKLDVLLPVDNGKILRIAGFLADHRRNREPMYELTGLNYEESEETIIRRIRKAYATDEFIERKEEVPAEEELLRLEENKRKLLAALGLRKAFTEKTLNTKLDENQIAKLKNISEKVWQRLQANTRVLEMYLGAPRGHDLPDAVLALSDAMLIDPIVWKHELVYQIFDDALMEKAILLIRECEKQGVREFFEKTNYCGADTALIAEVAKKWDEKKEYLQKPGFLKLFEGRWELIREFLDIEEPQQKILPWLRHFDTGHVWEWEKFIDWVTAREFRLPPESLLATLHENLGERVPYELARYVIDRCDNGEKVEDVCADLDLCTQGSNPGYDGNLGYDWENTRKKNYKQKLDAILGTSEHSLSSEITFQQYEEATKLSKKQLENLWKTEIFNNFHIHSIFSSDWANALYLADHRNFDLIAAAQENGYQFSSILSASLERVRYFCENIDKNVIDRWKGLKEELALELIDSVDFFRHSEHEEIIEFAGQLKEMMGQEIKTSAYDLLIMDVQKDLKVLKELKTNCAMALTKENLESLAVTTGGELADTIRKVLSIMDYRHKIDYGMAAEKIGSMSPGLRYAVLKNKGISAFGPEILKYKEQIKQLLSPEEWIKLLRLLFMQEYENIKTELDFEMASIILTNPNLTVTANDNYYSRRFMTLFKLFKGSEQEWEDLLNLAGDERLSQTLTLPWDDLPDGFRKTVKYWQLLKDTNAEIFLANLNEKPADLEVDQDYLENAINNVSAHGLALLLDHHENKLFVLADDQVERLLIRYLSLDGQVSLLTDSIFRKTALEKLWIKTVMGWKDFQKKDQLLSKTVDAGLLAQDMSGIELSKPVEGKLIRVFALGRLYDEEIDFSLGTRIMHQSEAADAAGSRAFLEQATQKIKADWKKSETLELRPDNWVEIFMTFVKYAQEFDEGGSVPQELAEKLKKLFEDDKNKDICLRQIETLWKQYLSGPSRELVPASLVLLANFVKRAEGAGPMSKIASLLLMIDSYLQGQVNPYTKGLTKERLFKGQKDLKSRFEKEGWDENDKTDFYNIFSNVLLAAPSLATDFMELFKKLNLKDMKKFMSELFPLFNVKILFTETENNSAGVKHDVRSLIEIRKKIREIKSTVKTGAADFDEAKRELKQEIQDRFQTRFGIIRVPENFGAEELRTLINCSIYLSNLNEKNQSNMNMLVFYMALLLNGRWEAFRRGEKIDPGEFMNARVALEITNTLEEREKMLNDLWNNVGIREEDRDNFQKLLQTDESVIEIGNIETIDVKLANLANNMRRLEDPDLYMAQLDKDRMKLLGEFGNKQVGAVASKIFLSLKGKGVNFSEEEQRVQKEIEAIISRNGLPSGPETIKKHFQEDMKPLSLISNVLADINNLKVEDEIAVLRQLLQPDTEVIEIFKRLGEDFQPASGAMALSLDLDFLDNLIVKKAPELSAGEENILKEYISKIRVQVIRLEVIYQQLKQKFTGIKGAQHGSELLKISLKEIEKIINATDAGQVAVSSEMTNNLNPIMENIRACLSCKSKGCNNDTNMTYGDGNKFFLYSHSEHQKKGSIADQVLFLEPVVYKQAEVPAGKNVAASQAVAAPGAEPEMAFVLDRVYGNGTPFILANHVKAVYKKYKLLKSRYPQCKLSILITHSAMSSSGTDGNLFTRQLSDALGKNVAITPSQASVNIVKSALGDHYVEFGGGARTAGERDVEGLKISL